MNLWPFRKVTHLEVDLTFAPALARAGLLDYQKVMDYPGGTRYKANSFRSVVRISLDEGVPVIFLKRHFKLNWKALLKSLALVKKPLSPGRQEWEAAARLAQLGIPVYKRVAWGQRSFWLFPGSSFFISQEIAGAQRLEDLLVKRFSGPLDGEALRQKRDLIAYLAELTRIRHQAGFVHHDFYLGHFLAREEAGQISLYLIDLQRVEALRQVPWRLKVKELAQLNFTASEQAISRADRIRFLKLYLDRARLTAEDKELARAVARKTERIRRHTRKLLAKRQSASS